MSGFRELCRSFEEQCVFKSLSLVPESILIKQWFHILALVLV